MMLSLVITDWQQAHEVLRQSQQVALRALLHRLSGNISYLRLPELERRLRAFHEAVKSGQNQAACYQALEQAWQRFEAAYHMMSR